jgi:hypothetical protein
MNVNVLIDSIVRQTTVLIAQLATTAGGRPSLAHTANQVFVDLVRELKEQGVGNKVIADMFGLALRTYHDRIRRLEESATYGGRSLWEAVLEFVQERGTLQQADVLTRFRNDDPLTVRGVLRDLVDSGLLFRSGRGDRVTYRSASPEEMALPGAIDPIEVRSNFVWVAVNRLGPATEEQLLEMVPIPRTELQSALDALERDGKIRSLGAAPGSQAQGRQQTRYLAQGCYIPVGDSAGWEAAVFDHYQALVTAVCVKLRLGADAGNRVGGSTYSYFVWSGHPMETEVYGLLARFREQAVSLRERVDEFNRTQTKPRQEMTRVSTYVGQSLIEPEKEGAT